MQALIDFIVGNIMEFWPFARVYDWECAMLVRLGKIKRELGAGIHWRWPFIDEVEKDERTEQTIDLGTCAITTKDGVSAAISANVSYKIVDLCRMWQRVTDFDDSLANLLLGLLAHYASRYTWDQLQNGRGRIERFMVRKLSAQTREWGVEITKFNLTDYVKARPYKLFVDSDND